jgi:hypothetical protein
MYGQSVEMDWGQNGVLPKNTWYQKIAGYDKDGYYVVKSDSPIEISDDNTYLEYYYSTTNVVESTNQIIMPSVNGMVTHYKDLFYVNQKLILLTKVNESSQNILYIQYLSPDGTLKNKPKDIGSIPISNSPKDDYQISLINNQITVLYHNTFASYNDEPFNLKIYNSDLLGEQNYSLILPLKGRSFDIIQYNVGKSGYVYLLAKCLEIGKKKPAAGKEAAEKYEYILLVYNPKRKEIVQFPVKADKYTAASAIFGIDKDENVVIAGFFANKSTKFPNEFMGAYFMKLNPRTQKVDVVDPKKSVRAFSKDFMAECSQERNGTTPEQYYNYILKDLLFFDNGGFAVIAEQEYTVGDDIRDPATKGITHVDYYHSNDLIIFGVTKENVLAWNIRLAKNQVSSDDKGYYHSYNAFSESNKIKIVFNDNKSNLNNKVAEKTKELKNNPVLTPKGVATLASIYPDGSFEKYNMFKSGDEKYVIVPKLIINIGNRYLTYAQDGRSIKFGTFTFE